ncbi:MAG: hypothetical protein NTV55_10865 [Planctomycetota bacterium]|nr:hypothetical protein [Planctomycetota bacterium]
MLRFSFMWTPRGALVALSGLALAGCQSMGGKSAATPPHNPCDTATCGAPAPEPPKKGFLGLCSHDKSKPGLLAMLKKQPHPADHSPVPLAPGEFIVSYGEGPPPMVQQYAQPPCASPVASFMSEGCPTMSTLMPSCPTPSCGVMSPGMMPSQSMGTMMPGMIPGAALPSTPIAPVPVGNMQPLPPNTVAPPPGLPSPGGTPQAQPMPAPGGTTSRTFIR